MEKTVSGRVIAKFKKGKNRNWLSIGSRQYGSVLVRAVLNDEDAKDVKRNDYVQITGKTRRIHKVLEEGTVNYILLMNPVVERVIRMKSLDELAGVRT